jgi:uncharacterized HAD superfamily protein
MNYSTNKRFGFDFDGVLDSNHLYQIYCEQLVDQSNYVCVISKRSQDGFDEIFKLVSQFGVLKTDIYCTDNKSKVDLVNSLKLDVFYDDEQENIDDINNNTNCRAILVKS